MLEKDDEANPNYIAIKSFWMLRDTFKDETLVIWSMRTLDSKSPSFLVLKYWLASRSTLSFIILNSVKWVPAIFGNFVARSNISSLWLFSVKDCVRYIFASLFCMSKGEHLWKKGKCFLFSFESSFRSWDNQIITF